MAIFDMTASASANLPINTPFPCRLSSYQDLNAYAQTEKARASRKNLPPRAVGFDDTVVLRTTYCQKLRFMAMPL